MATIKQKTALMNTVENGGNVTAAMREAGYKETTIHNPDNLTESKGYKQLLKEYGLTEELVVTSLVSDIKAKPKKRVKELTLGAEILGIKKGDGGSGSTYNFLTIIGGDQAKRIAGRVLSNNAASEESPDRLLDSDKPELHSELAP